MSSKIALDPNMGHGSMLTEVVRAYMHTGTPSALITRVMEGVRQYREEVKLGESEADQHVFSHLEHCLLADVADLRALEEDEYTYVDKYRE